MMLAGIRPSFWLIGGVCSISLVFLFVQYAESDRKQDESITIKWPVVSNSNDHLKRLQSKLSEIEEKLQYEIQAKRNLQKKVVMLENQLVLTLEQHSSSNAGLSDQIHSDDAVEVSGNGNEVAGKELSSFEEIMEFSGVESSVVEQIKLRLDEYRMKLLAERNTAAREGRLEDSEYIETMEKLINPAAALRGEFGDLIYDRYLYAVDKPNRVEVIDTYAASAAESVGIHPGDVILRYGDRNIYTMSDLRQATVLGKEGDAVVVEVQRNGERRYFNVPRGPVGVEMNAIQQRPY